MQKSCQWFKLWNCINLGTAIFSELFCIFENINKGEYALKPRIQHKILVIRIHQRSPSRKNIQLQFQNYHKEVAVQFPSVKETTGNKIHFLFADHFVTNLSSLKKDHTAQSSANQFKERPPAKELIELHQHQPRNKGVNLHNRIREPQQLLEHLHN